MMSCNVLDVYSSILHCLEVAAGTERSILAVTSANPRRTESTWMGFHSTLLLQLMSDWKIDDRIRTDDASLKLKFRYFPAWHSAVLSLFYLMSVCPCALVHGAESQKCSPACLGRFLHFSILCLTMWQRSPSTYCNCTYRPAHCANSQA